MGPRKILVAIVLVQLCLGRSLHPSVNFSRILENRKDMLRLRAQSASVQAPENLTGPHI